jgi:hypothetical protein
VCNGIARTGSRDNTQPTRNVRAGSMQPGILETGTNLPLTSDVREDWEGGGREREGRRGC